MSYDYDAWNRRFLMIKDGAAGDDIATIPWIITVQGWIEELKER